MQHFATTSKKQTSINIMCAQTKNIKLSEKENKKKLRKNN
jgi:hypothetical protein